MVILSPKISISPNSKAECSARHKQAPENKPKEEAARLTLLKNEHHQKTTQKAPSCLASTRSRSSTLAGARTVPAAAGARGIASGSCQGNQASRAIDRGASTTQGRMGREEYQPEPKRCPFQDDPEFPQYLVLAAKGTLTPALYAELLSLEVPRR
jgi:hypothetical protein